MDASEIIDLVITAIPVIIAVASAIAAATPTPKDDQALSKAYKIVDALALNVGKAKQTGKESAK